jgi:hypothetical protein
LQGRPAAESSSSRPRTLSGLPLQRREGAKISGKI